MKKAKETAAKEMKITSRSNNWMSGDKFIKLNNAETFFFNGSKTRNSFQVKSHINELMSSRMKKPSVLATNTKKPKRNFQKRAMSAHHL